jgi:hypothetical protein
MSVKVSTILLLALSCLTVVALAQRSMSGSTSMQIVPAALQWSYARQTLRI